MKNQSSVQKWKMIALAFAVLSVGLLATMLIMLMGKDWKILAVRPLWLFFLLMLLCGVSLIGVTVSCMRVSTIKAKIANTVICPVCHAECDCADAFCPKCGAKLQAMKNE